MKDFIKKNKLKIFLVLFIISLLASLILSIAPVSEVCKVGEGCEIVQQSKYAKTFGIKNSHFGVIVFALLSIVTYLNIKKRSENKEIFIRAGILISSLISLYFIYLQQFVLHAYCKYCMVVDISMVLALMTLAYTWND